MIRRLERPDLLEADELPGVGSDALEGGAGLEGFPTGVLTLLISLGSSIKQMKEQ